MTDARLPRAMLVVALVTMGWCAAGAWARATYGARTTADEPQYLLTALSLGEDQSLDIGDERAEGRYRDFHEVGLPLQEAIRADGSRVSPHDPLLPALLAVPMVVGGWLAAKLALAMIGGLLAAATLWVAVARFGVRVGVATITVLAFSLAAPLAVYSTQVYPEIVAALTVTIALGAATGPLRRAGLCVLGVATVTLPWLSVKYVPVAAVLAAAGIARLVRRGDRVAAAAFMAGLLVAAIAFVALHQAWYGGWTPYASGRHFTGGEATVMGADPDYLGRSVRLLGLLVDRGFGLAAWAPGFLLAVPAFGALARRRPRGWAVVVGLVVVGWCNATFVALTMHGWWWPGRQVVVVAPALVLAVTWWVNEVRAARVAVAVGGVVGALAAAWLVADVLSGHMTLIVDFERTTNPLYRGWRLLLPDGRAPDTGTAVLRVAWSVVVAALAALGWRSAAVRSPLVPDAQLPRDPARAVPLSKEFVCLGSR